MSEKTSKYPDALSRNTYSEGGYTFLHRVFRKNMDTKKPVVMSVGDIYVQYRYEPGQRTFAEGITILDGSKNSESYKAFMSVVDTFSLDTAFSEGGYERPESQVYVDSPRPGRESIWKRMRNWGKK